MLTCVLWPLPRHPFFSTGCALCSTGFAAGNPFPGPNHLCSAHPFSRPNHLCSAHPFSGLTLFQGLPFSGLIWAPFFLACHSLQLPPKFGLQLLQFGLCLWSAWAHLQPWVEWLCHSLFLCPCQGQAWLWVFVSQSSLANNGNNGKHSHQSNKKKPHPQQDN